MIAHTFKSLFLFLLLFSVSASAQLVNNGAQILLNQGAVVKVGFPQTLNEQSGDILVEPDAELHVDVDLLNNNGQIRNSGLINIDRDLINNDYMDGFGALTGAFNVYGRWENNGQFNADSSVVYLDGNDQLIMGSSITTFYNLELLGIDGDVKTMALDANVDGSLDLHDAELETQIYTMHVRNINPLAIRRDDGFVSSIGDGKLSRNTNSINEYLFPTGTRDYGYRPVSITPEDGADNTFSVRFIDKDATVDGFSVDNLDLNELCKVNPNFYHWIYRNVGGSRADIRLYYLDEDGTWNRMAHWQGPPRWESMTDALPGASANFNTLRVEAWNQFDPLPFTLASSYPTVDAGEGATILVNKSAMLDPSYFGAAIDSLVWSPALGLDCIDCEDPNASPPETTVYTLTVKDVNGCVVMDSVLITVTPNRALTPTAFSPNGDGFNDRFHPGNDNFSELEYRIFNRWGEKVYEGDINSFGWDGTFRGKPQEIGVYMVHMKYRLQFQQQVDDYEESRNLTLVR